MSTNKFLPLGGRQLVPAILCGIILWYAAATLLRVLEPTGIFQNDTYMVLLYLAVIPGTLPFVFIVMWVSALGRERIALGYSVATAAAMLCDGIALHFFPGLYGTTSAQLAVSGELILWGAGVGIVLACLVNRSELTARGD